MSGELIEHVDMWRDRPGSSREYVGKEARVKADSTSRAKAAEEITRLRAELSSLRGEGGKVVRSYRVQRKATEADPFAKKWPDWLKGRVAILGYLEQGFRACAQPSGKTIGSGEWGHYIVEYDDGSLRVQPNKAALASIPTPDDKP